MSIEITPANVIDIGSWHKTLLAHHLKVLAWIDDNFKSAEVQTVVDFKGDRFTDTCTPYYYAVTQVVERAEDSFYIDNSRMHHESMELYAQYIQLKASREVALMKQIKRDKIEALRKELAELETK